MPTPQIPNLLTVMDKLTMKNLYDSDPAEWSPERYHQFCTTLSTLYLKYTGDLNNGLVEMGPLGRNRTAK